MSIKEFDPDWVSAPGDTIDDILVERNLPVTEFAKLVDRSERDVMAMLQGRATITIAMARQLERILGGSVEFWMARDFLYWQDLAKLDMTSKEWVSELPIADMVKFGWLEPVPHESNKLSICLRFFDVPSVAAWREKYGLQSQLVSFRTSLSFESVQGAVAAWLRQGEIEAESIDCQPWNEQRFKECLSDIRSLTREKNPNRFIRELQKLCACSGVAVVVLRGPTGCRASGATKFLTPNKALLLLSFRYLSDDQFWFTFFHEAGHLLLHGEHRYFLEGLHETSTTKEEQEANDFAARTLIPHELRSELLNVPLRARNLIRFARRLGVSPGIVVGQLQFHGRIKHTQQNRLKRRYRWVD